MGTIKIINHSTFSDSSALIRIGTFLAGEEHKATHDENNNLVAVIKKQKNNTYLIINAD